MMNLTDIKHALIGTPPVSTTPTPDVVKLQVDLKARQLRRGLTHAEVERVKVKLDAARVACEASEQVDADEDSATALQRMTRAEAVVRDTEKELTIALHKDECALADLQTAERAVAREIEETNRVRGAALGPRGEELFKLFAAYAEDLVGEIQSSRLHGWAATELRGQFQLFVGLYMHAVTGHGHVSPRMMKFKTWPDCVRAHFGEPPDA
jgi:hypothetical protein